MHILILGGAGMVGRKLTERLVADGALGGATIARLTLHDVVAPQAPAARRSGRDAHRRTSPSPARPRSSSPSGPT